VDLGPWLAMVMQSVHEVNLRPFILYLTYIFKVSYS